MKKLVFLLILILIPLAAADDWMYQVEEIEMELNLNSGLKILPTSTSYSSEYVVADLLFFPKDTWQQEVKSIESDPMYEDMGDFVRFEWKSPDETNLMFSLKSTIRNRNDLKKVTRTVPFPPKYAEEYKNYTRATEIIDADDEEIIKQASKLAHGEENTYELAFKFASWVKSNLEYDLNTLTAEVSQKASWVLKNKYGVCDELTSLFIAMLRAVNVPARYVSGYAYTDWNDLNDWGPHAWAEVYLPGEGWVPFDIAYGQFGFVDATHIALKISDDADSTATKYEWRGRNVDLETQKLNIKIKTTEKTGEIGNLISIKTTAKKDEIGFGSYNLIEADVTNLKDYYVPTELYIAKTPETEIVGQETIPLLLKPREKRKVYWILKLAKSLKKDYVYTFPTEVYSVRNVSSKTEFKGTSNGVVYSKPDIEELITMEQDTTKYAAKLDIDCKPEKEEIYIDEKLTVMCTMTNTGNVNIKSFVFCMLGVCDTGSLPVDQDFGVNMIYTPNTIGKKEVAITGKSSVVSSADYINFEVLDYPEIHIKEIEHPKTVNFDEIFDFSFLLDKVSSSGAKNARINVYRNDVKDSWEMDTFTTDRRFVIEIQGRALYEGRNNFRIELIYEDNLGNVYKAEDKAVVTLEKVTLWQKVQILLYKMSAKIEKLFTT